MFSVPTVTMLYWLQFQDWSLPSVNQFHLSLLVLFAMDCVLVLLLALALQVVMMQIFALKISVDVEPTIQMQILLRHKVNASTHPTLPIVINPINVLLEVATQELDV